MKSFILMVKSKTQAYEKFYNNVSNKNENEPLIYARSGVAIRRIRQGIYCVCVCMCVCIYACLCVYAGALCCNRDVPNKLEHMGYFMFFFYRCQINFPMRTIKLLKKQTKKPHSCITVYNVCVFWEES